MAEENYGKGLIYEVPADLRYEERIFGTLTLRQLAVFSAFAMLATAVFTKVNADIKLRMAISGAIAAAGFAFATVTPLQEEVEKRVRFLWAPRRGSWTEPETLLRFVRVKGVEGNCAKLHDGRLVSILLVTPLDFSVLADEQKMALLTGYRAFLNSLSFPIQILARTTTLNLREYFAHAKAAAAQAGDRKALSEIESFQEFVEDYVSRRGVHDRLFYLIIPQDAAGNEEEARRQLANKTAICREKLSAAGLMCRELGEGQLVSLYASFLGGHVEADADYLSLLTLLQLAGEERRNFRKTEPQEAERPKKTAANREKK
ncbi:PrgI family protein [Candidatus Micrarchaeota archaeon]|nr:PrgI family protein [Candidatus Micrarchaeota archaeon]